jgi:hypothetical protein
VLLAALAERTGASCAVLFVARDTGPVLAVRQEVPPAAMDLVSSAWARKRELLQAGRLVPYGDSVIWPLFDGPKLVALVYLDRVRSGFPNDECRQNGADITDRLRRINPPSLMGSYLAAGLSLTEATQEVARDQLATALALANGNVTGAARLLGITRETVYKRAHRLDLDIKGFRVRFRRRGERDA